MNIWVETCFVSSFLKRSCLVTKSWKCNGNNIGKFERYSDRRHYESFEALAVSKSQYPQDRCNDKDLQGLYNSCLRTDLWILVRLKKRWKGFCEFTSCVQDQGRDICFKIFPSCYGNKEVIASTSNYFDARTRRLICKKTFITKSSIIHTVEWKCMNVKVYR